MNFSDQMKTEIIKLYVKPNSSITSIDGMYMDRIKVKISAPPEKGKANKELINFLSSKLDIPKKSISIISGKNSNFKHLAIKNPPYDNLISELLI